MNEVRLPALTGDSPLGVLAAFGVLRLLDQFSDDSPKLSWDPGSRMAVLHGRRDSVDAVVDDLQLIVDQIDDDSVLPGVAQGFPPPGAAPDGLRAPQRRLRETVEPILADIREPERVEALSWLASLVTDLAADDKGRAATSQFTATIAQQTMATMLTKPLEAIRRDSDYLRQALVSWRRVPGTTGEYLDHRALWDATDDGSGEANMRGVPGATWLALMSYPLLRTTASMRHRALSSGWHTTTLSGGRAYSELRLPLWEQPISSAAVTALVEHPALEKCVMSGSGSLLMTDALCALGIFSVCRARRYQPAGMQYVHVLRTVT